jgi:hypothetical protein
MMYYKCVNLSYPYLPDLQLLDLIYAIEMQSQTYESVAT